MSYLNTKMVFFTLEHRSMLPALHSNHWHVALPSLTVNYICLFYLFHLWALLSNEFMLISIFIFNYISFHIKIMHFSYTWDTWAGWMLNIVQKFHNNNFHVTKFNFFKVIAIWYGKDTCAYFKKKWENSFIAITHTRHGRRRKLSDESGVGILEGESSKRQHKSSFSS